MSELPKALQWENYVVLAVVQAMLGYVQSTIRGVAVEFDGTSVVIHFAIAEMTPELQEELDDVVADVEGLLWPERPDVVKRVFLGDSGPEWDGRHHRLVILAK